MCVFVYALPLYPATPGWGVPVGVCVWGRVSAAPRHSWLGCWGACVFVCALRLYLATPGWGVRHWCVCLGSVCGCAPPFLAGVLGCACARSDCTPQLLSWGLWCGCVCLGSGFGSAPPLLAGVLGCVFVCVRAPLVARHSWLGCAPWVCVLRLGFRLRPASPGWGIGVCVFVCSLRLYPATPGSGVRRGCVCLGSGFGCAPPPLAGVLGCVCVRVRAPLVPHHSLLGYAVWVGALGLWLRLRPATLGCGVGECVCALRLYPATPGWGVLCGCVCFGSGLGCPPPPLAGVLGCVCAPVRASFVPRHSWLGCTVRVCVRRLGFWAVPATPGWGVGLRVLLGARLSCTPPLWLGCAVGVLCVPGFGFRLRPASPGWGVGVCLFVGLLRLCPTTPGSGVRRWCVCLGSGFGCAPPLLGWVLGCVCACVRAPLVSCHSWLACTVRVCVCGLGF